MSNLLEWYFSVFSFLDPRPDELVLVVTVAFGHASTPAMVMSHTGGTLHPFQAQQQAVWVINDNFNNIDM
jgi:hypothetical protein